jgi:predicted dehydrogenase
VSALGVAIVGCGLIGTRRAASAHADERTRVAFVVDSDPERAASLAAQYDVAHSTDWRDAVQHDAVHAVAACTPNALLAPIAGAALAAGRHVLIEKPMGRDVAEAEAMAAAARQSDRVLKIGFNHRYHPAVARAAELLRSDAVGPLIQLRARYGHGSRPGCEQEWRGNRQLAGGGELLDQGVHVIDLFHWLAGPPVRVHAELQTAVWPLGDLEDNAFALFRFQGGVVGQMHVSMTQWKNLFSLEVHCARGALVVDGLGGSYGTERLSVVRRNMQGGVPEIETTEYPGPDLSWQAEWTDFVDAMHGARLCHGSAADGVDVMRTVAMIYAAASGGGAVVGAGTDAGVSGGMHGSMRAGEDA